MHNNNFMTKKEALRNTAIVALLIVLSILIGWLVAATY